MKINKIEVVSRKQRRQKEKDNQVKNLQLPHSVWFGSHIIQKQHFPYYPKN